MEAPRGVKRRLAAIFSADVAGYSRLMAEDEVATLQGLTAERELMTDLVRQHHGRVVDSPGDNLLAEFPSALDATRCAVEVQRALRARNADLLWHWLLQRSASESGTLRHGDGTHGRSDRCRRSFVLPILLRSVPAGHPVNEIEVFGPVATVLSYGGVEELTAQVAAGGGGLVSAVYSDDKEFVQKAVLGIAPHHGRVTIGGEKVAGQTVPPGTVMPQLLRGGPGRAGGGEELGGPRGWRSTSSGPRCKARGR